MYRLSLETLLGLHLEVDHLRIAPCIPAHWPSYIIHYHYRATLYHITLRRSGEHAEQAVRVTVDGRVLSEAGGDGTTRLRETIPLVDDQREHWVDVDLG
jgi:cellobiose phosphorylase